MMQYYDVALEHLSTIDLESFRSILPEHVQPFVLLSYPIRSERNVCGNSSTLRYSQREELGGQHVDGAALASQRVYRDDHGGDAGTSSSTVGFGRKVVPTGSGSDSASDCQPRPPYHSYHHHHAAPHSSASSSSAAPGPPTSHLPLCEPLTIPHPSTHPYNLFYDKGPNDALFVIFWAVFFTILREALMRWAYRPFIRWHLSRLDARERTKDDRDRASLNSSSNSSLSARDKQKTSRATTGGTEERLSKKEQRLRDRVVVRFAEQAWTCTYATVFWSLGFYILHLVPTNPFSSRYLWHNYPHTPLSPLTKFYYLVQLGFWFHQLFVFNLEARRKDYYQMLTHHFVTIALVMGSYWANYTRVGTVILVLMDFCDIWLPLAKLFRYLRLPTMTDLTFVVFLISWLITRQIGFSLVTLSCIFRARHILPWGWHPEKGQYANAWVINGFPALLIVLLIMNCIWFWMACNVAWRVVMGLGAEDTRSDGEDDIPESDAETRDGVTGDLVSSKGKDEVHPERAHQQAAAKKEKAALEVEVELNEKTSKGLNGNGTGREKRNGSAVGHGHGKVNGVRVQADE